MLPAEPSNVMYEEPLSKKAGLPYAPSAWAVNTTAAPAAGRMVSGRAARLTLSDGTRQGPYVPAVNSIESMDMSDAAARNVDQLTPGLSVRTTCPDTDVGAGVGATVGRTVGVGDGVATGAGVGGAVGGVITGVGSDVGCAVAFETVGAGVGGGGVAAGLGVGAAVGTGVGSGVGVVVTAAVTLKVVDARTGPSEVGDD
jgi:hypothetical protein